MTHLRSECEEAFSVTHKFWRRKEEKSIKDSVFELYKLINYEENSALSQKIKTTIKSIIWCLQVISLLWVPDLPVKNWHKNMIIWEIIGYLKFDNACSILGVIDGCFYLSVLVAYGIFITLTIFVTTIYYSYSCPRLALDIFSGIIYIWLNFFLVPSIQILSIFLKYSFLPKTAVSEYENHSELWEFNMVSPLQICIIFAILITFILKLFQVEFSGEIRHSVNKIKLNAKAHSKVDTHIALFTIFIPIVYVILAENYIIYLQILVIIFAILLTKETVELLPYFSIFFNSVIILRLYFIGFASSIFLLGSLMDNSLVISILAVILGPLSAIFVIQFSLKSQKETTQAIPTDFLDIESQYALEKSLRYALCSNDAEHKDQIIRAFENFFMQKGSNGNKLQAIWAANYCLYTLKQESLAKIKLSKTKHIIDWSLESNYQEYLCQKNISNTCLSEDSQFSDYFLQSILVKNEEKQLCINLLMFWSEITSHQPNLPKLRKLLNSVGDEILLLDKKYNQLISKFPNSKSLLSLYYSYCKDIIYNTEKSILLEAKLRSVDKALTNFFGSSKEFSFFNENNGILIISNETSNFGEILYANQKSAEFLRISIGNIKNDNISNFIHPYYKDKFREDAKWFIQYSSSSEMDLRKGFFLTKNAHNLLQLEGKVILTSINNLLMAILVFKPKISKHEAALISEEGEIICHSDNFPKSIGRSESLVGLSLKNLFFNSEEFNLQPNIPYHLSNIKAFIILSYSDFYKMKIPYVILMNDYDEVLKWKNGNSQNNWDQIQITPKYMSLNLLGSTSSDKTISSLSKGSQNSDDNLNSKSALYKFSKESRKKNAEEISEKSGSQKSFISSAPRQSKLFYLIKSSSRSINILHFAFVFSILTVLAVNITVLIYAFSNINFISDMSLPINIGKAAKNFQRVTYVTKLFLNVQYSPDSPILKQAFDDALNCLKDLENTYIDVTTNLKKWNYCSGQSILTDENLYLWIDDNGIYKKKSTLIDIMAIFIKIGNEILNKINNSKITQVDDFSFLTLNGYGEALHYSNASFYDIIDCQKSMMSEFRIQMIIFLSLGVLVLCICMIIIIPFYYSIFKIENELWNNVRKNAYTRYFELKQTILDRLRDVHSQPEIALNDRHISKKPYPLKSYWKYIWRVLIYMTAVLLFSLINITYLYEKCADYLVYRPEVLKNSLNLQISYTTLSIWTNEVAMGGYGRPMAYQFPTAYPFENSLAIFNEIISKIKYSTSIVKKNKYSIILSENFKKTLYEKDMDFITDIFRYGVFTAKENIINEAYLIANDFAPNDVWLALMSALQELDYRYDIFIDEIDKLSKNVIDDQMKIIVVNLAIFIVFSLALYFGFYLLFFWSEKKYLKKINSVMEIIP